jgi:hypothetical protein
MTEISVQPQDLQDLRSNSDVKPPEQAAKPSKAWLIAALTLLGSSGVLAVFGLITGEMYWDGYLSAFGLTTDEFPASSSSARVYAYISVLYLLKAVLVGLLDHWLWLLVFTLIGIVIASIATESAIKGRLLPKVSIFQRYVADTTWRGAATRVALMLFMMLWVLLGVTYLLLCTWLVISAPTQARQLGAEHATQQLSKLRSRGKDDLVRCSQVDQPAFVGKCAFPIAFAEKTVAVMSGDRIYRVSREGNSLTTPLAPAAQGSAASSPQP